MTWIANRTVSYTDGRVVISTALLSDLLGVTERMVQIWGREGCPQIARGRWDLKQVLEWRGLAGTSEDRSDDMSLAQQKMLYEAHLKKAQTELQEKIDALKNPDYRLLLTLRYINGKTWEQIAEDMDYTPFHVMHRMHPKALEYFQNAHETQETHEAIKSTCGSYA